MSIIFLYYLLQAMVGQGTYGMAIDSDHGLGGA